MHIAFKFKYIHDNGLFTRLLHRIDTLSHTALSLHKEGTAIHHKSFRRPSVA